MAATLYYLLTRIVLGYLAADNTHEQIIQEFPDLSKQQISACLDYALVNYC
ncbi:MAG TPA: hypothetical protein DCY88_11950 [Cyanobacteria bacterium UBA11372]|nr:hypothetical protein [Cyanobacteria bacterium UBA11372]